MTPEEAEVYSAFAFWIAHYYHHKRGFNSRTDTPPEFEDRREWDTWNADTAGSRIAQRMPELFAKFVALRSLGLLKKHPYNPNDNLKEQEDV